LTGLACTFLHDGRAIFHTLSNKHKDYTREAIDNMFDRKLAEREKDDLGWPHCTTLQKWGAKQCGGCQHNGVIKSPLNLAVPVISNSALDHIVEGVKDRKIDPVVAVRELRNRRASNQTMISTLD